MPGRGRERAGDEFAGYVGEMFAPLGAVQSARLFSGHGFKRGGVQFAMIIRGTLYLRVHAALAEELSALGAQPFAYNQPFAYKTKLRSVTVASYCAVPEDRLDEPETLLAWARRAIAAAHANAARAKVRSAKSGRGSAPAAGRKIP